jgi:hypothetical protein
MYSNITIERLEQIEQERNQTIADVAYQRWMQDLKVGSRYIDNGYRLHSKDIMQEWDITRFRVPDINAECM